MASKTGALTFALLLIGMAPALAGQESPLQWPVPPPGPPREPVFPEILIGIDELARRPVAEVALLDVRGAGPYRRGHLPGAAPVWSPEEEAAGGRERVRALLAERGITGEGTVVLYGDADREAVARLFWLVRRAGCPRVRILDGGLAAWQAAGHPLETGISRRAAAELRPPGRETGEADAAWVAAAFGQPGTVLLDVRDARGWDRWQTPPVFGAGHIPHSLPFDPRSLLPAGEGWPQPAALFRRLAALGPRPGDPVPLESTFVLYGEDARDPRIGLGYLLLTLAGLEARVFAGGWREWTADGARPVVRVISAAELASLLQREDPRLVGDRPPRGMILLDLREARDFEIGHLPGARGLPYRYRSFAETFEAAVAEGWPDADRATVQLVLYCYGPDCVRSRDAAAQAARLGFRNTLWFRGGVTEWRGAGLPLPAARAWRERASPGSATARRSP
jgi:thiosulfate/3-mercaptopyruvate sulfurtransferase